MKIINKLLTKISFPSKPKIKLETTGKTAIVKKVNNVNLIENDI